MATLAPDGPPAGVAALAPVGVVDRFLTLKPHEFLIFAILFTLLALCLAAAPLVVLPQLNQDAPRHQPDERRSRDPV
jgi:hypothetical protein